MNYVSGQKYLFHDFFAHVCLCPVLSVKNIVLTGFGKITLLDLDTIDLSNLNRQFLFKKKDVKQSKALVRFSQLLNSLCEFADQGFFIRLCCV